MLGGQAHALQNHRPAFFEWKSPDETYWVFGWRVGKGERKISFLTHLNTVAPGDVEWGTFEPRVEPRIYRGSVTPFLVGRGAIDDKGPAVVTLDVLLQVLRQIDADPSALDNVNFELLFDTSEETDFSTERYFEANPAETPTLGIVFDATWCIRAEKGIERPVFSVAMTATPTQGIWIDDFRTDAGPTNQIPDLVTARIAGATPMLLDAFAVNVERWSLALLWHSGVRHMGVIHRRQWGHMAGGQSASNMCRMRVARIAGRLG